MTMECSPELAEMVRRCALPVSVAHDGECFGIATHCAIWFAETPKSARSIYLRAVSTLTNPGASPSLPGTAAADPALSSPGGAS